MAVEELHFAPYMVESSASNPDFAVFFRHYSPYVLMSASANADFSVFLQKSNYYSIEGVDFDAVTRFRHTQLYTLMSATPTDDRVRVMETKAYEVLGSFQSQISRLEVPHVTAYEIETV